MNKSAENESWDLVIEPKVKLLDFNLKEVWKYRDLLMLFVKRDLVTVYQQTILGPLWFFLQPILTSFTYFIVFGKIANIGTGEVPQMLFYLSGITIWNYFTTCLNGASSTFSTNANIFGKVYFPRIVTPLSALLSNIVKFFIQLLPLIILYVSFVLKGADVRPSWEMILLPLMLFYAGFMGMSIGLVVSSLTTKYRDFSFVMTIVVQSLMYLSTVIYPIEKVNNPILKKIIQLNPMTWVIDSFRVACFGHSQIDWYGMFISGIVTIVLFFFGLIMFNKTEKTFIDTV
ncbi:MAG: ABC transporter permease [Cytophagales bacterium]